MKIRVGMGFDVHRLKEGRKCIIGGVEIPHHAGPDGHSDADVLIHAICDALLGAAGLLAGHGGADPRIADQGLGRSVGGQAQQGQADQGAFEVLNGSH